MDNRNRNLNYVIETNYATVDNNELSNIYYSLFNVIPNISTINADNNNFNTEKLFKYLNKNLVITKIITYNFITPNETSINNTYFIQYENNIIILTSHTIKILYEQNITFNNSLIKEFSKSKYTKNIEDNTIDIIVPDHTGYTTTSKELKRSKFIPENYNEDFLEKHKLILENLKKDRSGLYLFYGKPGTGKSSYIASLTSLNINKKFIYVPSSMFSSLDSPVLMSLFLDYTNSVFIIEDAEKLLISRESDSHSPISALLNMSDGLIGQLLSSQIICTFNTDSKTIDSALMRKGRLICSYDFKELEKERAINLAKKINMPFEHIKTATLLTDIYNYNEEKYTIEKEKTKIGFQK